MPVGPRPHWDPWANECYKPEIEGEKFREKTIKLIVFFICSSLKLDNSRKWLSFQTSKIIQNMRISIYLFIFSFEKGTEARLLVKIILSFRETLKFILSKKILQFPGNGPRWEADTFAAARSYDGRHRDCSRQKICRPDGHNKGYQEWGKNWCNLVRNFLNDRKID